MEQNNSNNFDNNNDFYIDISFENNNDFYIDIAFDEEMVDINEAPAPKFVLEKPKLNLKLREFDSLFADFADNFAEHGFGWCNYPENPCNTCNNINKLGNEMKRLYSYSIASNVMSFYSLDPLRMPIWSLLDTHNEARKRLKLHYLIGARIRRAARNNPENIAYLKNI